VVQRSIPREAGRVHNLLLPLTPIVGRSREVEAVSGLVRRRRLVTVAGPGGVGKTRLALEIAGAQAKRRPDGVWFVDVALSTDVDSVPMEVARVFGIRRRTPEGAVEALRAYLAERTLLLLLDNCEQFAAACAELASVLLAGCPNLAILATSREVLDVESEAIWRLDPLELEDARRLFVQRARERNLGFVPATETDATIAAVCARVDCLPLGIELAAARVGVMSPREILNSLHTELGSLGSTRRRGHRRHRTLEATVEWSYRLLDPLEQAALRAMSVFAGSFDIEAAGAVVPGPSVDLVARLVDKSLLLAEASGDRTRYRLLQTVRDYAHRLLAETGELAEVRLHHLRYFSGLAGSSGEGWPAADADELLERMADDYENVRTAIEWSVESDACAALDLLERTKDLFTMLGQADGLRLARLALARCPTQSRTRAVVEITTGVLAMLFGDAGSARKALDNAARLSVALSQPELQGWARFFLGLTEMYEGAVGPAREHLRTARSLHHELGFTTGVARATAALGLTTLAEDPRRAGDLVEEALALNVANRDSFGQGQCHIYLGLIAEATDARPHVASSHYRQAAEHLRRYPGGPLLPIALIGQASVLRRNDPVRALTVAAAAFDMRTRIGGAFPTIWREHAERARTEAETALGESARGIWTEGRRLTVDEAIALAFGANKRPHQRVAGLSSREFAIARLIATGMTNKEVAATLHLSVRTVENHVYRMLRKLGLANRTELAVWTQQQT
jgi:predicted ATPase/DNA-binding CsgD family transcriptional regulator